MTDKIDEQEAIRTFNVRDYGAVCNGKTDDTAAIQGAINAATLAGNDGDRE